MSDSGNRTGKEEKRKDGVLSSSSSSSSPCKQIKCKFNYILIELIISW